MGIKRFQKFLFCVVILYGCSPAFSQTQEIKIKFIGNCGLYLTDGTTNIYIDFPYKSGAFHYMKFDDSEMDSIQENSIFLFTHKHPDHYSSKNMRRVLRKKKGAKYGKWNIEEMENLAKSIPDFKIEVFKTKHRFSFCHYSYLITWHGKRIYLSGDTETADTILEIKNIDWAFVPTWIMVDAQKRELKIDAKNFGIYHLYPTEIVNTSNPSIHILKVQGEILSIPFN